MTFHQSELQQLETHFANSRNEIVIFYGDAQNAVHETLRTFLKNKPTFYYRARSASARLQLQFFYDEIREDLPKGMRIDVRYSEILSAMLSVTCEKRIIVIDEFHLFLRSDPTFMDELIRTVHNKWNNQKVLFLLSSTNKNWVEQDMVSLLSEKAYEVSALIEQKDLTFADLKAYFPEYDFLSAVETYGIFGALKGNWAELDPALSLQENLSKYVLTKGSYFYERGMRILPEELREPTVYHTLLCALASGRKKLNDLYKLTGYDRAKISVYLKNMTEYHIVEKVESYNAPGHENVQKGIYRIVDPFVRFWFCFVFPHYSKLSFMESEKFNKKYIDANLRTYAESTYVSVCSEFLLKNYAQKENETQFETMGTWFGKVGTIDFIATTKEGKSIAAYCNFEKNKMTYADLEWNQYCLKQARIKCDRLYLFSYSSFDEKLKKEALSDSALILIDGELQ
ncbi:MAG: hypothetical protein K6A81_07545 [Clostridiales bacterium]|nr:hypothetical protein [Clostridiales bacterium]